MSDKKQYFAGLPTSVKLGSPSRCKRTKVLAIGLCLGLLGTGGYVGRTIAPGFSVSKPHPTALCPQVNPITPTKHSAIWESFVERTTTDEYKTRAIEWLGRAVRIPYVYCPSFAWNRIQTTVPDTRSRHPIRALRHLERKYISPLATQLGGKKTS